MVNGERKFYDSLAEKQVSYHHKDENAFTLHITIHDYWSHHIELRTCFLFVLPDLGATQRER